MVLLDFAGFDVYQVAYGLVLPSTCRCSGLTIPLRTPGRLRFIPLTNVLDAIEVSPDDQDVSDGSGFRQRSRVHFAVPDSPVDWDDEESPQTRRTIDPRNREWQKTSICSG